MATHVLPQGRRAALREGWKPGAMLVEGEAMRFKGELLLNTANNEMTWPVNTTKPCQLLEAFLENLPDDATSLVLSIAFIREGEE